jgi:hypothetical protein
MIALTSWPASGSTQAHPIAIMTTEDGDYGVSKDKDRLVELFEEQFGAVPVVTRATTAQLGAVALKPNDADRIW